MDSIVTLKSKTGNIKLPKTVSSAVLLDGGSNLQTFVNNIQNEMSNHNHDDQYYLKQEVQDLITNTINGMGLTSTYTKSEINAYLSAKAPIDHNHNTQYYTKAEIDAMFEALNNPSSDSE